MDDNRPITPKPSSPEEAMSNILLASLVTGEAGLSAEKAQEILSEYMFTGFDVSFAEDTARFISGLTNQALAPISALCEKIGEQYRANHVIIDELRAYIAEMDCPPEVKRKLSILPVSVYFDMAEEFLAGLGLEHSPEELTPQQRRVLLSVWDEFLGETLQLITEEEQRREEQAAHAEPTANQSPTEEPQPATQAPAEPRAAVPPLTGVDVLQLRATPTSQITHLAQRIFNYSAAHGTNALRPSHDTIIEYINNAEADVLEIRSSNSRGEVTITLEDATQILSARNKATKKVFTFLLQQANAQHFREQISFPLQDLVDVGMYSKISNAREGVKKALDYLLKMRFSGSVGKGKKKVCEAGGHLFYHYEISRNTCTVHLNKNINMQLVAQYFTYFPSRAFSLNSRAYSVAEYIFYLARQNADKIKAEGSFRIGLQAIADYLCLPSPKDTRKHTDHIIEPLDAAITEIEDKFKGTGMTITPVYREGERRTSVYDFLSGYILVGFSGEWADSFISFATQVAKKEARREKIKEAAQKQAEVKRLEAAHAAASTASATD